MKPMGPRRGRTGVRDDDAAGRPVPRHHQGPSPSWARGIFVAGAGGLRVRCPTTRSTSRTPRCPTTLQQALTDATGTYEQMDFTNFGQSLGALGDPARRACPADPTQAMENLRRLADIVGTRRDQIGAAAEDHRDRHQHPAQPAGHCRKPCAAGEFAAGEFVERRAASPCHAGVP